MTEVIGVRFRGGCKEYYFDPHGIAVEPNQFVIVETAQGTEYAQCVSGNHEVADSAVVPPLRPLVRIATENDRRTFEYNKSREKDAFATCQKKIAEHRLDMKLVRVESNFDGSKIIFFFTSEGRVDFRELVRDLASVFRARIELRQIGVRDEAKMLGGLGICGRPFCCAQFLDDFIPVSIKMAKTQNLSLNPTKISGTCGRLMCCLKYEQDAYEDAARRCPKADSFVATPDGLGNVSNVDILREQVVVKLDNQPESPKRYRNCEISVLRNGKGSRDGISIPRELPERYREPAEDPFVLPVISAAAKPEVPEEAPAYPEASEKRRSRGHRGGRNHRGGRSRRDGELVSAEKAAAKDAGEGSAKKSLRKSAGEKPAVQKVSVHAVDSASPAEGGGAEKHRRPHRHRGGRSRRSGGPKKEE